MTDVRFVPNITPITADWLNDVNTTVNGLPTSGGAALVGTIQTGTGAVLRTVQAKLRESISGRDFGGVPGLVTDQSALLQAAWDASAAVGVPFIVDGVYWVSLKDHTYSDGLTRKIGLQVPSNSQCVFMPGAAIHTIANNLDVGYTINTYLADNFEIYNPVVYGERSTHTGSTGESQHCFNIVNCTNGYLHRPVAHDAWGDGIYVGIEYYSATNKQTQDVTLFEPRSYNARRNGFSVTSGINIKLLRPYSENVNGTSPQSGIDLEPEGAGSTLPVCVGWLIDRPTTKDCLGAGINIYTDTLPANSIADIHIPHHKDSGSAIGMLVQHGVATVRGRIVVTSPHWELSKGNGIGVKCVTNGPRLYVTNPIIENCGDGQTVIGYVSDSAIWVGREAGEPAGPTIGNFSVTGVVVRDTRTVKKTSVAVYSNDGSTTGNTGTFSNAIIDIIEDGGTYPGWMVLNKKPDTSVRITTTDARTVTSDETRSAFPYYVSARMGEASPANVNITLDGSRQPLRALKMCQSFSFAIKPQVGGRIYPIASAIDKGIYSNDPGASVNLYPTGANDWIAEIVSGTWVTIP
jgi:hypothetical protein